MQKTPNSTKYDYATGTYDYEYTDDYLDDMKHLIFLLPPLVRVIYRLVEDFLDSLETNDSPIARPYYDKESINQYAKTLYESFKIKYPKLSMINPRYSDDSSYDITELISAILIPEMYNRKRRRNNISNRVHNAPRL